MVSIIWPEGLGAARSWAGSPVKETDRTLCSAGKDTTRAYERAMDKASPWTKLPVRVSGHPPVGEDCRENGLRKVWLSQLCELAGRTWSTHQWGS